MEIEKIFVARVCVKSISVGLSGERRGNDAFRPRSGVRGIVGADLDIDARRAPVLVAILFAEEPDVPVVPGPHECRESRDR